MTVRVPHGGLLISEDCCAWLALASPAVRAWWRDRGYPLPAEVDQALQQMRLVAEQRVPLASADVGSSTEANFDRSSSVTGGWVTTAQAAGQLGVTTREVVDLLHRKRLRGERDTARSAWRIEAASVERFAAERRQRGKDNDGNDESTAA